MREIIVNIDKQGNIDYETKGFKGSSCKEAAKFLEKLQGNRKEKLTPEYYQQDEVRNNLNISMD